MPEEKDLNEYPVPAFAAEAAIDFLDSRSLDELEEGIRRLDTVGELMGLVQGVAIVKIESEGLWQEAGYANLRAYRIDQAARLGMPASTISTRRRVAEAWLAWRKHLGRKDLSGHASKLRYLDIALEQHGDRKLVMERFWKMGRHEFEAWARGPRMLEAGGLPDVDCRLLDGELLLDGEPVLELDDSLDEAERTFIAQTLQAAYRARAGNCLPHVVACYDQGEIRAVERFIKERRASR